MAKTTSIALGEHFNAFIQDQIATGRYASASEVVREALRLMEREAEDRKAVRLALEEGERSGSVDDFDMDAFLAAKRRQSKACKG